MLNLFDRIYGEDSTGFVAENTWVEKHGNWIATSSGCVEGEKQWGHVNGCYISSRGARLLQLMSPTGKLFKSMLKMNWHFQMNVNLLSEKAQMKLGNSKEYLFIAAAHHLLYDNLLKMQPQRKVSLHDYAHIYRRALHPISFCIYDSQLLLKLLVDIFE